MPHTVLNHLLLFLLEVEVHYQNELVEEVEHEYHEKMEEVVEDFFFVEGQEMYKKFNFPHIQPVWLELFVVEVEALTF